MEEKIDTTNDYLVGALGDEIVVTLRPGRMDKAKALRLAAYLVAIADDDGKFPAVLAAVAGS